jgi:HEPN domain-containing protein
MNRADLQKLSNMRIREAKILFAAGEHSGAYYLAGYAVECALKACIAKGVQRYDFPDKSLAQESYSHDLVKLVKLADLDSELTSSTGANARLDASWNLTKSWTENSRYSVWTKNEAEAIIDAVATRSDGVLAWIKRRW